MANYNLVVNSTFTPFTYEQYLAPFKEYKEAYQNMEDKISALQEQADTLEILANNEQDRDVYNQYKTYSDQLHAMANDLATKGLAPNARGLYLGMKSKYAKEIVPIQNAYAARAAEAENQYKGRAQGIVYENDAANTPLSTYIANPQFKHGMADSNAGYKRVMQAASALSRIAKSDYNLLKSPDPYTARIMQQYGLDPETITQDINQAVTDLQNGNINNLQNNSTIQSILRTEMQTSGVANWQNSQAQLDYLTKVAPALYAAIGESKVSDMALFGPRLAAQSQAELNLYKEKLRIQEEKEKEKEAARQAALLAATDPGERTLSGGVITDKDKEWIMNQYKELIDKKFITPKGQITPAAMEEMQQVLRTINWIKENKEKSPGWKQGTYNESLGKISTRVPQGYQQHRSTALYELAKSIGITDDEILNWKKGKPLRKASELGRLALSKYNEVNDKNYTPKYRNDVNIYSSNINESSAQSELKSSLSNLSHSVVLYPVNGVDESGIITTSPKGKTIGEIMQDDKLKPTMISVTPSEEGTAMIKIGDTTYKLTQANLRDLLGNQSYEAYAAATRGIAKASSSGAWLKSIQDAKNYLGRALYGVKGKSYEADLTEGINYTPDFEFNYGEE